VDVSAIDVSAIDFAATELTDRGTNANAHATTDASPRRWILERAHHVATAELRAARERLAGADAQRIPRLNVGGKTGRVLKTRGQMPTEMLSLPRPSRSREWLRIALLECARCHQVVEPPSPVQRYCGECSELFEGRGASAARRDSVGARPDRFRRSNRNPRG
jgi:hypothetical protein